MKWLLATGLGCCNGKDIISYSNGSGSNLLATNHGKNLLVLLWCEGGVCDATKLGLSANCASELRLRNKLITNCAIELWLRNKLL